MKKAFKTELDPNNKQITAMRQHCGAARWAYNWGLERIKPAVEAGEKWPSAIDLHRQLNAIKGTDDLPWAYAVSKCAFQEALRNLDVAVRNWRSSRKGERKGAKVGFPRRKTKKRGLGGCRFTGTIKVVDGQIQLPRIGVIRLKEHGYIPVGMYGQATITERAGHWFVSIVCDVPSTEVELADNVIGIDVGVKTLATCSNGDTYDNPKALNAKTKQLRRWQRRLSRRAKGGKNRAKARQKVARLHKKIADSDRIFVCGDCGHTMDRDLNAAINLKNTASSAGINAYGDRVSLGLAQAVVDEVGIMSQVSIVKTLSKS
ncbi:MAG: RNA-guided endonuclease TnpB family protein [Caldilineaceae bacterium]